MFINNFEAICRDRGTTMNAAVVAIGRPEGAASRWKRNGTLPKENELVALARYLDCAVADFFLEDGAVVTPKAKQLNPQEWRLLWLFNELEDEADKAEVMVYVRNLVKAQEAKKQEELKRYGLI